MKRDWSKLIRTSYYAVKSERGQILPRTIRTKPGDSMAELYTNPGLANRNDPTKVSVVRVKVTEIDQPAAREQEIAELVDALIEATALLERCVPMIDMDGSDDEAEKLQADIAEFMREAPPTD